MTEHECEHTRFRSQAGVTRLTDEDGKVVGYAVELTVNCDECGRPFLFKGLPLGMSLESGAFMSFDRAEARFVIEPGAPVQ